MSTPRASRRTLIFTLVTLLVAGMAIISLTIRDGQLPGSGWMNRLMRSHAATGHTPMYAGIQSVQPAVVRQLFPEHKGNPFVLVFTSRFCLDCKHLKPMLEKQWEVYPTLSHLTLDIMEDRKTHAAVFRAFKPVSVPTLILVRSNGAIANVLYNPHTREELTAAFDGLLSPVTSKKAR